MKFLLVAINAKYIHSNLGVYSLRAYAKKFYDQIDIAEFTINHQLSYIMKEIYKRSPDVIGFSCYIWNIAYVIELAGNLHKLYPSVDIWLGGPEVSYDAVKVLEEHTSVKGVMIGEGEKTFLNLMNYYTEQTMDLEDIEGTAYRKENGCISDSGSAKLMDLSEIPFSYKTLEGLDHKIIYYESSRGCPYSCSYCLSSIDKRVRFRDLKLVKKELQYFLDHNVPQVKFVDRTFNCKKKHAMEIWSFILEHDNGITNFHFEISADLLSEEELNLLESMRPELIQLEIGVQSANPLTIKEIDRTMDLEKLDKVVKRINSFGNIHQHLDLIAGLPYEDYKSFHKSFNIVYNMKPNQLQLGFLKVLKGSKMHINVEDYGLVYHSGAPYEVLYTKWLTYKEVIELKAIEEMVELYYNSGQFAMTIEYMTKISGDPFLMFERLANYYEENHLFELSHNRLARYEILFRFLLVWDTDNIEKYRDLLMYDLYLRENIKSRPSFAREQSIYKDKMKAFFRKEEINPCYLLGYIGYNSKQMSKMTHVEVFLTNVPKLIKDGISREAPVFLLFDYQDRDALTYNAKIVELMEDYL